MNTLEKMTLDKIKETISETKKLSEEEWYSGSPTPTERQRKIKYNVQQVEKLVLALDENNKQ